MARRGQGSGEACATGAAAAAPPGAEQRAAADAAGAARAPVAFGACLLLGFAIALLNTTLPDAVLLPAVDRLPPRHLGLAIDGVLLSLGAWLLSRRRLAIGRTGLLLLGAATLLGCLASAALLPALHDGLAAGLRGEGPLPYYPLVALASIAACAPAALPLGALLAVAFGDGRRRALAALLLGLAAGFVLAPWSADVLLGATRTLQVTALIGGSAALLFVERTPRPLRDARLAAGGATAALALGVALLVAVRLFGQQLDRGPLLGPALAALLCLGALPGLLVPRTGALPLFLAALAAGLPALFPADSWLSREIVRDTGAELLTLALVALPSGLLLGALAAQALAGSKAAPASRLPAMPLAWLPALLLLLAPVTSLLLMPHLEARAACALPAAAVVVVMARRLREHAVALCTLALVMGLSFAGIGPAPPAGSVRAEAVAHLPDGDAALVRDPATGRKLLAIDGHAAFGRSAAQERRFALLPLLLRGGGQRVLVIASGFGETASAAWSSGIAKLHWLQPFTHPEDWDVSHWPGEDPPTTGSERQFLAVPREPYDVIVMAPDARVSSRGALLGTEEFYRLAAERLAPDGLLCQWWDLADIDISDLKSVIASAAPVFPSCSLLMDHPRTRRACVGLLLSRVPLEVQPDAIDRELADRPDMAVDLHGIGLDGLGVACLVTADRGMLELLAPAESSLHDDRPVLGVRGALREQDSRKRLAEGMAVLSQKRRDPMPWIFGPPETRAWMALLVRDRFRGWQHLFGGARSVVQELGPAVAPFDREAPGTGPEVEAPSFVQALAPLPDCHELVELVLGYAARLEREGRIEEAEGWLRQAIATDTRDPALHFALGALQERRGLLQDAAVHYTSVLTIAPGHPAALQALHALEARGIQPPKPPTEAPTPATDPAPAPAPQPGGLKG